MRKHIKLAAILAVVLGFAGMSALPAGAVATPPPNTNGKSDTTKTSGSDTIFFVLNDLALAFNETQGCETYQDTYTALVATNQSATQEPVNQKCADNDTNNNNANTSQPNDTITSENFEHDTVYNLFPRGSSAGFRQLCRREATSGLQVDIARSSAKPADQAANCATTNGGDAGAVFRWISFAKEQLSWMHWLPSSSHTFSNLTVQELKDIFVNCTFTHWNQVGTGPAYVPGTGESIRVWTPIATSGSRLSWDTFLGGSTDNCIPAEFKDANVNNGNRVVREHQAIDVQELTVSAELIGLNGPDGIAGNGDGGCSDRPADATFPGCRTAVDESHSIYGGFSCALFVSSPANAQQGDIGSADGVGCGGVGHPFQRDMFNVIGDRNDPFYAPSNYPLVNGAGRRFTDMRPTFPPTNQLSNGYVCMPLNQHSSPTAPGRIFAYAAKNYGLEKQAVLTGNGFGTHKSDPAYQALLGTGPDDTPFCKVQEWGIPSTGNMTNVVGALSSEWQGTGTALGKLGY